MAEPVLTLFVEAGLSEQKAKETLKNDVVTQNFKSAIEQVISSIYSYILDWSSIRIHGNIFDGATRVKHETKGKCYRVYIISCKLIGKLKDPFFYQICEFAVIELFANNVFLAEKLVSSTECTLFGYEYFRMEKLERSQLITLVYRDHVLSLMM